MILRQVPMEYECGKSHLDNSGLLHYFPSQSFEILLHYSPTQSFESWDSRVTNPRPAEKKTQSSIPTLPAFTIDYSKYTPLIAFFTHSTVKGTRDL